MSETIVDTAGLESRINEFESRSREVEQQFARSWQHAFAKRIAAGAPEGQGKLKTALAEGGTGNISEFFFDAGGLEILYGINEQLIPYAVIQSEGGVIVPIHAKALAIPLSEAARKAVEAAGGSVRSLDLFLMPGTNVLADKLTGEPMFVLKTSVTIKGSHYIERGIDAFETSDLPALMQQMESDLATLWNGI